jgi:predicted DCC family thiol-disulfide oxidoreductase YuxK
MDGPVLLYDGVCGFCNRLVQFILRHDRRGTLRFAALDSGYAQAIIADRPDLIGVDSVVWIDSQGNAWVLSDGALKVAEYLGGPWRLLLVLALIPRPWRDAMYEQFARRRYRWFGRLESCPLPSSDVRARFLDSERA